MKYYALTMMIALVGFSFSAKADLFSQADKAHGKAKLKQPTLVQVNSDTQEVTGVFKTSGLSQKEIAALTAGTPYADIKALKAKGPEAAPKTPPKANEALEATIKKFAVDSNRIEDNKVALAKAKLPISTELDKDAPTSAWFGYYYGWYVPTYYTFTYWVPTYITWGYTWYVYYW